MSSRLEIVGNLLMGLISVVFALAVIEIGLRVTNRFDPAVDSVDPAAQIFTASNNDEVVFEHLPNARATYPSKHGNPTWYISTDASGIRQNGGASDTSAEIRGICMGDSIMFGAGLSNHETIPAQLSDAVSRQLGQPFECLNFGVSNYTTAQEVAYFHHKRGLSYEPKIVVLGLYTNDFKTRPGTMTVSGGKTRLVAPNAPTGFVARLSRSRVAAMIGSAILLLRDQLRELGLLPRANEKPLRPAQIASVEDALDQLRADLDTDSIPLLIVLFPRDWQLGARNQVNASPRQQWAKRYCERNQIVCIDVLDHYFGKPIDSYFRNGDDSHPHAEAAATIAKLVAPAIVQLLESSRADR
jgi:lysophospholipase L1-like esterase